MAPNWRDAVEPCLVAALVTFSLRLRARRPRAHILLIAAACAALLWRRIRAARGGALGLKEALPPSSVPSSPASSKLTSAPPTPASSKITFKTTTPADIEVEEPRSSLARLRWRKAKVRIGALRHITDTTHLTQSTAVIVCYSKAHGGEAEANFICSQLEELEVGPVLMGGDAVQNLDELKAMVHECEALVLVQTAGVYARPSVLVQLLAAIELGVPIVAAQLVLETDEGAQFDFLAAAEFLLRLDTRLGADEAGVLRRLGITLTDAAFKLSTVLPAVEVVQTRGQREAAVAALVTILGSAELPRISLTRDAWLLQRDRTMGGEAEPADEEAADEEQTAPPSLAPELPEAYDPAATPSRAAIFAEAKAILGAAGAPRAKRLSLRGAGGTGKTTLGAALARDRELLNCFDLALWVTVGEAPDVPQLQRSLLGQLGDTAASTHAVDALPVKLSVASAGRRLLLVIDDVWQPAHAEATPSGHTVRGLGRGWRAVPTWCQALDQLDDRSPSACVVTTRLRGALKGAVELPLGLLLPDEAVSLLLRVGHVAHLVDEPPAAAREAVEACGRLPLLLSMAGATLGSHSAMIRGDEEWTTNLAPMLRGDNRKALRTIDDTSEVATGHAGVQSIEERIIGNSLRVLLTKVSGPVLPAVFQHLAAFPEDLPLPTAIFDTLAPAIVAFAVGKPLDAAATKRAPSAVRKALLELSRFSLLLGTIQSGLYMHDIVRGYAIAKAEAAPGGLHALQRRVVRAMARVLGAGGANGASDAAKHELLKYATVYLSHHVALCVDAEAPLLGDRLVSDTLFHHAEEGVRIQTAVGVGLERLHAAVEACEAEGDCLTAGRLWLSVSHVTREGKHRWAAWAALQQVAPPTATSAGVEASIIMALQTGVGGYKIGSDEHLRASERLDELERRMAAEGTPVRALSMARQRCASALLLQAYNHAEGNLAPLGELQEKREALRAATPNDGHLAMLLPALAQSREAVQGLACAARCVHTRVHAHAGFSWDDEYGADAALLRAALRHYEFATSHEASKRAIFRDPLMSGLSAMPLLLHWGDAAAAQVDWANAVAVWEAVVRRIHSGKSTWQRYNTDLLDARAGRGFALSMGRLEVAKRLLELSPEGMAYKDASTLPTLEAHVTQTNRYFGAWGMGCSWTVASAHLLGRALGTLLRHSHKERTAAAEWLPPPAELLRIADDEKVWDVYVSGAQHPALLGAALHAQLGQHAEAEHVARGVLERVLQPLTRVEALRLLARCCHQTGRRAEAKDALARAAAEAAGAQYAFLELLLARETYAVDKGSAARAEVTAALGRLPTPLTEEEFVEFLGHPLDADKVGVW